MPGLRKGQTPPTKGKGGRPVLARAKAQLTKRQLEVVRRGSAEIRSTYGNTKKAEQRFRRSAIKDIASTGKKGYKQALVKSARATATKGEAKGVRKVLSRTNTSTYTSPMPKKKKPAPKTSTSRQQR